MDKVPYEKENRTFDEFEAQEMSVAQFIDWCKNTIGISDPRKLLNDDQMSNLYKFRCDNVYTQWKLKMSEGHLAKTQEIANGYERMYHDANQAYLDRLSDVEKIQLENERAKSEKLKRHSEKTSELLAKDALRDSEN